MNACVWTKCCRAGLLPKQGNAKPESCRTSFKRPDSENCGVPQSCRRQYLPCFCIPSSLVRHDMHATSVFIAHHTAPPLACVDIHTLIEGLWFHRRCIKGDDCHSVPFEADGQVHEGGCVDQADAGGAAGLHNHCGALLAIALAVTNCKASQSRAGRQGRAGRGSAEW